MAGFNAGLAGPQMKARFADLGATVFPALPPTSASSSAKKPKNGAGWSARPIKAE